MGSLLKKIVKKVVGRKNYSLLLNTKIGTKFHDKYHENSLSSRDFLLQMLPKNSIGLEIGVDDGIFTERILEIVRPKKLHLVDPWKFTNDDSYIDSPYGKGSVSSQTEMDTKYEKVLKKFSKEISENIVVTHRGYSEKVLPNFENDYFDWVYIDGDHHYEFVKSDLKLCYEKVKHDHFITGDDYRTYDKSTLEPSNYNDPDDDVHEEGVKRALEESIKLKKLKVIKITRHQFITKKL